MANEITLITVEGFRDRLLKDKKWLFQEVWNEHIRQCAKWGIQTHPLSDWYTFLAEEVGELAKAISEFKFRQGSSREIIEEAIQTATLALKIAEMAKFYGEEHGK